ncbi:MAG: glycosyltransferase [Bacteroidota bacterium]
MQCAKLANGDFLFFMDDDNVAKPTELETLLTVVLQTNADAVACANDFFTDAHDPIKEPPLEHGRWVPLGPAELAGMFTNVYGDTNSLIKKSSFLAVGGFPEDYSYALEDWELLARMVTHGIELLGSILAVRATCLQSNFSPC